MAEGKKLNITITSILLGVLGAVLVSSSAFYMVLKFGTLTWSSITVTTISILILNFLKEAIKKEAKKIYLRLFQEKQIFKENQR